MSEAIALEGMPGELGPPERLHPLYLLTGLGQTLKGIWGLVAGGAYFAAQGKWWIAALLVAGFALFSFAQLFIRWSKLEYRVGPHERHGVWVPACAGTTPLDAAATCAS